MRIESPEITRKGNWHVLSAGVGFDSNHAGLPGVLWFAVRDADPCFTPGLADAFLVSLLATAMKLGEDIRVEGGVSSCLAHGLMNYQRILGAWWPESFKMIDVDYANLLDRRNDRRPPGVACALSGGPDSLTVFSEWLPGKTAIDAFAIDHAVTIDDSELAGDSLDVSLSKPVSGDDGSRWRDMGVDLMAVSTNQGLFRRGIMTDEEQNHAHSSELAACAHALAGVFGRISISSHGSYAYDELTPRGSHPAMDHHLGSDQLQVIHVNASPGPGDGSGVGS